MEQPATVLDVLEHIHRTLIYPTADTDFLCVN